MKLQKLEDFNGLKYDITIHRNRDGFLLHIAELHLFAQNPDLQSAYAELETEKEKLFRSYFDSGKQDQIPLPTQTVKNKLLQDTLTPYFIKLGAFALVGVLLISAANISLTYSLQHAPKRIAQKAAQAVLKDFGSTLEKVVKREFTPDKEARIREGLQKFVAALEPFMDEFEPLYRKE